MDTFDYAPAGNRVKFGSGTLQQLPSLLKDINATAVLILSTPEQISSAETVKKIIGDAGVAIFSEATMHTPVHITEKALSVAKEQKVDGIISIGGGSTVGLGKAISIRTGLPHLCIPTTYAGSEMTPILGETENGRKTTRRDPKILPSAVLYDVDLFKTLPVKLTVYSGINAIAHSGQFLLTYVPSFRANQTSRGTLCQQPKPRHRTHGCGEHSRSMRGAPNPPGRLEQP